MSGPKCDADGCGKVARWIRVGRGGWSYTPKSPGRGVIEPKDAEFYCDRHAYALLFLKFNKLVVE